LRSLKVVLRPFIITSMNLIPSHSP
jgi:hypothetical protein